MNSFKGLINLSLFSFIGFVLQAQDCTTNFLSSKSLANIPSPTKKCVFRGKAFKNLVDVTLYKSGTGPDLEPYIKTSNKELDGIWIGKNNSSIDYTDVTFFFSKPVTSVSFILSSINNDGAGREEVKNFKAYSIDNKEIIDGKSIQWITGASSGYTLSNSNATTYDPSKNTVLASNGSCCESSSGRVIISSTIPFTRISFRHEEFGLLFCNANGVILSEMNFCIQIPPVKKEVIIENKKSKKAEVKVRSRRKLKSEESNSNSLLPKSPGEAVILKNVLFEQGKDILLKESYPELDMLAKFMKDKPSIKIELHGHTDSLGKQEINLKLSEMRVEKVKAYLISKGISQERIHGKGFGGLKPIAPGNTEENRKKNRRVEFIIIEE